MGYSMNIHCTFGNYSAMQKGNKNIEHATLGLQNYQPSEKVLLDCTCIIFDVFHNVIFSTFQYTHY